MCLFNKRKTFLISAGRGRGGVGVREGEEEGGGGRRGEGRRGEEGGGKLALTGRLKKRLAR